MLIKSYASFWNPDVVEWQSTGNDSKLMGEIKKDGTTHSINFWKAKGIYVLHSDFRVVYIGKAFKTSIGDRLREHLSDRFAGRWDMFSWYSLSSPRFTRGDVSQPGQRQLKPSTMIDTLEALGILIADPSLNRKRESLKGAYEAEQPEGTPRTTRSYLQSLLDRVESLGQRGRRRRRGPN